MENYINKILAVDDNEIIIKLIEKVLEQPNRTIVTAYSGNEALIKIRENKDISLILMDIQMPGIDGFETVRLIKEEVTTKDIPVIFITGVYKTDEFVNKGFEIGAFDYIQKPFDSELLKNKVNVFLTLQSQQKLIKFQKNELDILLKSIADGVITISNEGIISFINESGCKLLEIKPEEAFNKNINDLFKSPEINNQAINFIDWIKQNNSTGKQLLPVQIINGEIKIISIEISEIKNQDSNSKGIVIVFNDVTNTVRAQNQKALSQKMESVGQLASGIAHEINTPMQFIGDNTFFIKDAFDSLLNFIKSSEEIINNTEISDKDNLIASFNKLKEDNDINYLYEEIPTAIERTQNGIQRVSKIVLAMKNFAHPSTKQKSLSNINQGVDVTITISRNEWKYIAEMETELDPNLPLVNCTIDEINQVILNMIVNASHAIEDALGKDSGKQGKIKIKTNSDKDWVHISISDTGKGIPEQIQSRIFDPFFTTKEVGKGTGQGLAIAHDIIVNKHEGEIEVNSEVGKGTTFTIKLPINLKQESIIGGK